jgi:hypothetical protein
MPATLSFLSCVSVLSALLLLGACGGDAPICEQSGGVVLRGVCECPSNLTLDGERCVAAAGSSSDASTKHKDAGKDARAEDDGAGDDSAGQSGGKPDEPKPTGVRDAGKPAVADAARPLPPSDAGAPAATGDGGSVSGIDDATLEMLRQVCTDEINMYRATLKLAPLARATHEQELCSDRGSQKDGIAKVAHGSAGSGNPCNTSGKQYGGFPGFGAQDTCPGWPVGKYTGAATIADALKGCLKSMWNEGVPAEGTDKCIKDYYAGNVDCFEMHGHYINMSSPTSKIVSCGFYDMGMMTYWMNQDFI